MILLEGLLNFSSERSSERSIILIIAPLEIRDTRPVGMGHIAKAISWGTVNVVIWIAVVLLLLFLFIPSSWDSRFNVCPNLSHVCPMSNTTDGEIQYPSYVVSTRLRVILVRQKKIFIFIIKRRRKIFSFPFYYLNDN